MLREFNQLRFAIRAVTCGVSLAVAAIALPIEANAAGAFHLQEATIDDIQKAILSKQITTKEVVELYLKRIKAYNGTCVSEPQGMLGVVTPIPNAGQLNALQTLNLRPATVEFAK